MEPRFINNQKFKLYQLRINSDVFLICVLYHSGSFTLAPNLPIARLLIYLLINFLIESSVLAMERLKV